MCPWVCEILSQQTDLWRLWLGLCVVLWAEGRQERANNFNCGCKIKLSIKMLGSGSRTLGCDISDTKKSVVVRVWGYGLGYGCGRGGLKGKGNRKKKSSRILEKPRLEYHWGQIPGRGSNQPWFVLIVQIILYTGLRVILLSNLEHWEAHLDFWKKREQSMEHFKILIVPFLMNYCSQTNSVSLYAFCLLCLPYESQGSLFLMRKPAVATVWMQQRSWYNPENYLHFPPSLNLRSKSTV